MSRFGTSSPRPLGRRGSTAVEMAIAANVFFLLLIGGFEIGRYFFVSESLRYVVGEVAREAIVRPSAVKAWNDAAKASFVASRARILTYANFSSFNITVEPVTATPDLTKVVVAVAYNYNLSLPGMATMAKPINTGVTMTFAAP